MKVNVKVIVFVFVFVIVIVQNYDFQGFCFYVKLGLSRLSAVVLPQDANLFEDGGGTATDTSVSYGCFT